MRNKYAVALESKLISLVYFFSEKGSLGIILLLFVEINQKNVTEPIFDFVKMPVVQNHFP